MAEDLKQNREFYSFYIQTKPFTKSQLRSKRLLLDNTKVIFDFKFSNIINNSNFLNGTITEPITFPKIASIIAGIGFHLIKNKRIHPSINLRKMSITKENGETVAMMNFMDDFMTNIFKDSTNASIRDKFEDNDDENKAGTPKIQNIADAIICLNELLHAFTNIYLYEKNDQEVQGLLRDIGKIRDEDSISMTDLVKVFEFTYAMSLHMNDVSKSEVEDEMEPIISTIKMVKDINLASVPISKNAVEFLHSIVSINDFISIITFLPIFIYRVT